MQNVQPLHEGTVIILIKITGVFTLSPSKHISRTQNKTPANIRNNTWTSSFTTKLFVTTKDWTHSSVWQQRTGWINDGTYTQLNTIVKKRKKKGRSSCTDRELQGIKMKNKIKWKPLVC